MHGLLRLIWTTGDPKHYTLCVTVAPAADSAGPLGRVKGSLRRSEFSDRVAPLTRPARSLCPCHCRSDWHRDAECPSAVMRDANRQGSAGRSAREWRTRQRDRVHAAQRTNRGPSREAHQVFGRLRVLLLAGPRCAMNAKSLKVPSGLRFLVFPNATVDIRERSSAMSYGATPMAHCGRRSTGNGPEEAAPLSPIHRHPKCAGRWCRIQFESLLPQGSGI